MSHLTTTINDRVKALIQIEQSYDPNFEADNVCREALQKAILTEVNYPFYMAGTSVFDSYEILLAYLITSKQL